MAVKIVKVRRKTEDVHKEIVKSRKDLEDHCAVPKKNGCSDCPLDKNCPLERVIRTTEMVKIGVGKDDNDTREEE